MLPRTLITPYGNRRNNERLPEETKLLFKKVSCSEHARTRTHTRPHIQTQPYWHTRTQMYVYIHTYIF